MEPLLKLFLWSVPMTINMTIVYFTMYLVNGQYNSDIMHAAFYWNVMVFTGVYFHYRNDNDDYIPWDWKIFGGMAGWSFFIVNTVVLALALIYFVADVLDKYIKSWF